MDQQIKQQWVDALRSGTYQQTYGVLRDEIGYCANGVLCELHRQATGGSWDYVNNGVAPYQYKGLQGAVPMDVLIWAELTYTGGVEVHNDDRREDFPTIADYIDANL